MDSYLLNILNSKRCNLNNLRRENYVINPSVSEVLEELKLLEKIYTYLYLLINTYLFK